MSLWSGSTGSKTLDYQRTPNPQFSSVSQLSSTPCNPIDCSTPSLPAHCQLPEFSQTHAHRVGDAIQPTITSAVIPFSSCLQSFPASGSFPRSQFFSSGGQSPSNEYSGLISFRIDSNCWVCLQSKRLSRFSSNAKVQKHQFFERCYSS